jgi:protein-S-isoprenylcysteine O-methyltransferase Ste14
MFLLRLLVGTVVFFGVIPAVLTFSLAGRWDLWNVWAYAGMLAIFSFLQILSIYRKNPDLLKERGSRTTHRGRAYWMAHTPLLMLLFLQPGIVGLDQRFHWSDIVPLSGMVAGLAIVAIGWGLIIWATSVNSFSTSAVQTQVHHAQRVISEGPYALMRHPGYAGSILAFVASGLALNSLVSMLLVLVIVPILAYRTMLEDQMLRDELAGYAEYAAKVRYRLIPGIW